MGDAVAAAVLAQFAALPKTGKPQAHEHTVLAGIALSLPAAHGSGSSAGSAGSDGPAAAVVAGGLADGAGAQQLAVVSIGTGTKCLGASQRQPCGGAVNDSHAEVLCRRGLLRWLYCEMQEAVQRYGQEVQRRQQSGGAAAVVSAAAAAAGTAVLRLLPPGGGGSGTVPGGASSMDDLFGGWRFELQPGVRLHMYVSQPPCGDASILGGGAAACDQPPAEQQQQQPGAGAGEPSGHGRTGAKPLKRPRLHAADSAAGAPAQAEAGQLQLPRQHEVESYAQAQATGVTRRKPGRGDATLSMSCSDKLARWVLLGLQGSLLDGLLAAPLHLSSVTVSVQPPTPSQTGAAAAAALAAPAAAAAAGQPQSAAAGGSGGLAAAAKAALRRALLERTAELAASRLPPGQQPAAPSLHTHVAAAESGAAAAAAPGWTPGGSCMHELGLAPSAARRVAGGSSLVWVAPPSNSFKWKPRPAPGAAVRQAQPGGPAAPAAAGESGSCVRVLSGGSVEAVAGSTGMRVGSARLQPGQAVPPSAQARICRAALLAQWQQLAGTLQRLSPPVAVAAGAAAGGATGAGAVVPAAAAQAAGRGTMAPAAPAAASALQGPRARTLQGLTYAQAKHVAGGARYRAAWGALLRPPSPLDAWLPKPRELDEFTLPR